VRKNLRLAFLFLLSVFLFIGTADAEVLVAIDPAHGGADPGSKAGSAVEKDWNLRFARSIARSLKAAGFEVLLIREKDETLDLKDRLDRINASDADLAIVIHADREPSGTRSGPLLVVQPPTANSDPPGLLPWGWVPVARHRAGVRLAKSLARSLGASTAFQGLSDRSGIGGESVRWDGGILCASHANLRYLTTTAVVLTPLFLTSKSDLERFSGDEAVEAFAAKVTEGVRDFLRSGGEENP